MPGLEDVWRTELPHVLAALTRRYGRFADCEDAAQLALIAAAEQWPRDGVPEQPRAWLLRVASRRLVDGLRSEGARRAREDAAARGAWAEDPLPAQPDDALQLMVLCCHPALSRSSQVALTLRAVAGLTTAQIAAGFLVPEATMAQRISRAKTALARSGARFAPPRPEDLPGRLLAVRHAVSLLFTEGHLRSAGAEAMSAPFAAEAIALARELFAQAPSDPENAGLLALLVLTHARAAARVDGRGDLVPLADQDRALWDRNLILEGVSLLEEALPRGYVGEFQLQAAIAAVHAEAATAGDTDWPQILELYRMLEAVAPSAATTIGVAAATAEAEGLEAGLMVLRAVDDERNHRVHAVRGHLLARLGDADGARAAFERAAQLTRSIPEQRYLHRVAAELPPGAG
ncbi:RNA polymerase sigma24 factor [Sinomonas cyclohexanicum]|uniref:RNA polymerase sigma24 factor n=2 Tax=Sinomonas cyclohexanicum TaxID=322009 RepID=A0ABM7PRM9_SINCY|nr:RNA polymerase sigma24 factor [Corynebacterium cyclohexanicum]